MTTPYLFLRRFFLRIGMTPFRRFIKVPTVILSVMSIPDELIVCRFLYLAVSHVLSDEENLIKSSFFFNLLFYVLILLR